MSRPTNKNSWQTPKWLIDIIQMHREITLDPCTVASNPVGALYIMTPEDDGLKRAWNLTRSDVVFMNPPFGRGHMKRWTDKFLDEMYKSNPTPEGWVLCKLDTTEATAELLFHADVVCIPFKRINYEVDGEEVRGVDFPSVLLYYGRNSYKVVRHLTRNKVGNCFTRWGVEND